MGHPISGSALAALAWPTPLEAHKLELVHTMSKAKAGRGGNTPTKLEFTPPPPHPK